VATLQELADKRINMTKLESRPSKEVLGQYVFLVDVNGHRLDPAVAAALERIRDQTGLFKVFGSYPCWRGGKR
jgi:prephenate dehydratase